MSQKISLKFNQSNFIDFLSKFQDLASIDDVVKLKIDQDNILIYSMISTESQVLAMKNYILKTSDYIDNFDSENIFDFIITSSSKFVKNLKFFDTEKQIKLDLIYKPLPDQEDVMHIRSAQFSNNKLKISCIGGEEFKIRDLNKSIIESRMDPKKSKWSFKLSNKDFSDVKKLCSINSEDKTLNITVQNGKVFLNEL